MLIHFFLRLFLRAPALLPMHLVVVAICRASDRSRKKSQISRDFLGQNRGKIGRFRRNFPGIFRANLAEKQSVKKRRILWLFFRANFARNLSVLH